MDFLERKAIYLKKKFSAHKAACLADKFANHRSQSCQASPLQLESIHHGVKCSQGKVTSHHFSNSALSEIASKLS